MQTQILNDFLKSLKDINNLTFDELEGWNSMASLREQIRTCYSDCIERIDSAKPEHKAAIKRTSKVRLEGFLDGINMRVWRGRQTNDMIWKMFEAIDER